MRRWSDISLTAQTAYAQLFDAALAAEHVRGVADLSGSFVAKSIKGHTYWYYQYTEPSGDLRQMFVGPDSSAVQSLRESKSRPAATAALLPLTRSASALGCAGIHPRHYRVLKRLAEYGFFAAGGLLIGTHAFIAYANMLGVKWGADDTALTQDIDFAHPGKRVELALMPGLKVQVREAIESLEMGFLPLRGLSGKPAGSYLLPNEPDFRLDFLTCATRRGEVAYEHPDLNITLQPLKFMEFSLEKVSQAVLLSSAGSIVVNLPDAARFSLHKLIVMGEREGSYQTKSNKDGRQAALLIDCLREQRPDDLREAWSDLRGRGRSWLSRARKGLASVDSRFDDLRLTQWFEEKK